METTAFKTKFLLDSGDPEEYKEIAQLAKNHNSLLWGSTTNPTLIAKRLSGQKFSQQEAFDLQKRIVLAITEIVPGAVSAEVYADEKTSAQDMIAQGKEIAIWHERVVVKLPTTVEGFKARTALRQKHILTNNTLVFSQEQIFAICLHEKIIQNTTPTKNLWPPFISPFVGRLDDQDENGMDLVKNGLQLVAKCNTSLWMLEASVRQITHVQQGIALQTELLTAPAKLYREWFSQTPQTNTAPLKPIQPWEPHAELYDITTLDAFMQAVTSEKLNITHPLTTIGLQKFASDWNAIIA